LGYAEQRFLVELCGSTVAMTFGNPNGLAAPRSK
jgi:hypothetical protein